MCEGAGEIVFGIYAASPTEGSFDAVFSHMTITECMWKSDAEWRVEQKVKTPLKETIIFEIVFLTKVFLSII